MKKPKIGDLVYVPDPSLSDLHSHAFAGKVVAFKGDNVVVTDQDDVTYEIEVSRLLDPSRVKLCPILNKPCFRHGCAFYVITETWTDCTFNMIGEALRGIVSSRVFT